MAYKISDDCISCGACANECPVTAISEGMVSMLSTLILVSNVVLALVYVQ